jgi:hypothetical protein
MSQNSRGFLELSYGVSTGEDDTDADSTSAGLGSDVGIVQVLERESTRLSKRSRTRIIYLLGLGAERSTPIAK